MIDAPFRKVMTQKWRDLAFFHYCIPPAQIQKSLPPGFEPDLFDGKAWVGFVPFWMYDIRVGGRVRVPFAHKFHETNLRTYVRWGDLTGVWFYSLDADSPLAVRGARCFYGLNYVDCGMSVEENRGYIRYRGERRREDVSYRASAFDGLERKVAEPGSLEHFLVERYRLFSVRRGQVFTGEVRHAPYSFNITPTVGVEESISRRYGLPEAPFIHGLYSPGVDVEVGGLVRIS